jgi:hypothetical protein
MAATITVGATLVAARSRLRAPTSGAPADRRHRPERFGSTRLVQVQFIPLASHCSRGWRGHWESHGSQFPSQGGQYDTSRICDCGRSGGLHRRFRDYTSPANCAACGGGHDRGGQYYSGVLLSWALLPIPMAWPLLPLPVPSIWSLPLSLIASSSSRVGGEDRPTSAWDHTRPLRHAASHRRSAAVGRFASAQDFASPRAPHGTARPGR